MVTLTLHILEHIANANAKTFILVYIECVDANWVYFVLHCV